MNLQGLFFEALNGYGDAERKAKLWAEIEKHYTAKGRHYHNLQHLEHMIAQLQACHEIISDWETLLLSVFYHDIIYKAAAKDNEEKSAECAKKSLRSIGYPEDKVHRCQAQILATKTHSLSMDSDTNILTDADLSILGSSPETYQNYTKQVRKEYAIYPDFLYKPGRRKVLEHFIAMEPIFKTPFFRECFEENAKKNLTRELEPL